jgi:hypothetical protein
MTTPPDSAPAEPLIDVGQTQALFGELDAETCDLLLAAAAGDLENGCEALIAAWQAGDANAVQRARHSLQGVCGHFGATALLGRLRDEYSSPSAGRQLRATCAATVAALRSAAASDGQ